MKDKTILLVDDDTDFMLQQRLALESMGCRVIEAGSRKEALKLFDSEKPDLAILDLMMEEMDSGFVLAHQLKEKQQDLPVILVTAVTHDTGIQFNTHSEGGRGWIKADTVMQKPVRFEQLKQELERLL